MVTNVCTLLPLTTASTLLSHELLRIAAVDGAAYARKMSPFALKLHAASYSGVHLNRLVKHLCIKFDEIA